MAKKLILNNKIVFLIPRSSINEELPYPIVLLNNRDVKIEDILYFFLDKKYNIGILITKANKEGRDENVYYFPIEENIINDFHTTNLNEIIINNGYLDNFTEIDNVLVPCRIVNKD